MPTKIISNKVILDEISYYANTPVSPHDTTSHPFTDICKGYVVMLKNMSNAINIDKLDIKKDSIIVVHLGHDDWFPAQEDLVIASKALDEFVKEEYEDMNCSVIVAPRGYNFSQMTKKEFKEMCGQAGIK